jgi:hypothetical protein
MKKVNIKIIFISLLLSLMFASCEKQETLSEIYLVKFRNASFDLKDMSGNPISLDTISFVLDGTIDTVPGLSGKRYDLGRLAPGEESDFIAVTPGKYAMIVNDTLMYKSTTSRLRYWLVTESNIKCIFQVVIENNRYNFWRSSLEMLGQPMIIPY